ncbi:MAG TPA: POTRA domain-containing protein [Tepidisphaeraceae bacterium]|nr:POTRA domain-containing protein [Tepidisphaeraceae bacterium]
MRIHQFGKQLSWLLVGMLVAGWIGLPCAHADEPSPGPVRDLAAAGQYAGRTVESVRVLGNTRVSTSVILELVRTRVGDKFDPATVVGDYQRIYDKMRKFGDVEARVQPTPTGVIVIFVVTEQKEIKEIRYDGNVTVKTHDLQDVVDLKPEEAIDPFRVNLAQQAIERLYSDKNYPYAHVTWSPAELQKSGVVFFHIVEGPQVRIRKIDFIGNNTFSAWKLKDQIKTGSYIFIFNPGKYDPELLDEDVASLIRFYRDMGFFDVRVGRKISRSPDMTEMQITFVIDEGVRYVIDQVLFQGNLAVPEGTLRMTLKSVEGVPYNKDGIDRDVREMVKAYSRAGGYIYEEQPGIEPSPDYLRIDPQPYYEKEPGKVRLVYEISEGKQFRQGRILIKGNSKTQDKVILRELHMRPGQRYDSSEIQDAEDRLRGLPEFSSVSITPVGDDPNVRDLLVDVTEQRTAQISAGIGINSDGGFGGQLGYEQQNFDVTNFPTSWGEAFSDRAFTGAGQDFTARFDPGTQETDATISFFEPYLFDQPYTFGSSLYYEMFVRPIYNDDRAGGNIQFGKRFTYVYSASVILGAADVDIKNLALPLSSNAPEINAGAGHHTLTTVTAKFQRDTTNHGPTTYEGTDASISFTDAGAMGGTVDYDRIQGTWSAYQQVNEDLLGRRSVIDVHIEAGDDPRKAPFYERFYGGGIGTIRGFEYWGVSPRSGPADDAVGADFFTTGGVEYGFPLAEDFLRGVLFVDVGDYEPNMHFGVIRTSVGFGFRLVLPFLGKQPLALDFGFPITQSPQDNTQVLSFSFGFSR